MKSLRLYLGTALIALLAASCGSKDKPQAEITDQPDSSRVYPVRTQKIAMQSIPRTLDYTANLEAYKTIHLAPASPGHIHSIGVEIGDRIRKGQLLVEMDPTQLNQAATQFRNAKTNYERIDTLNRLGSISRQQYDMAKTQYEIARSSFEFMLENTKIKSPINGIVTGKYYENGEMYSGAPNTAAGKAAIITIMQTDPMKAVVGVAESYYPDVKEGMKVDVSTDVFPGEVFTGQVSRVYPVVDPASRNFNIEISVDNTGEQLKPGMYAYTKIALGDVRALVVPSISVLKQEGTDNRYVFLNYKGTARKVRVQIGERYNDLVELISDRIKEGEELITEGQANLLNGSSVSPVK